jgi:hypothetical protein
MVSAFDGWSALQWAALVLQPVMVALAIAAYVLGRGTVLALVLAACICHAITHTVWFTFWFAAGIAHASTSARPQFRAWAYDTGRVFHILFLLFAIAALVQYLRQRRAAATPTI